MLYKYTIENFLMNSAVKELLKSPDTCRGYERMLDYVFLLTSYRNSDTNLCSNLSFVGCQDLDL